MYFCELIIDWNFIFIYRLWDNIYERNIKKIKCKLHPNIREETLISPTKIWWDHDNEFWFSEYESV